MACRWPFALVVTAGMIAAAAIEIIRNPIPIRVDGGVLVEKIVMPIALSAKQPLPVRGQVSVIDSVQVKADGPLPVNGDVHVQKIEGLVDVGAIRTPVTVADVNVGSIKTPVAVSNKLPFKVTGDVQVQGNVQAGVNPLSPLLGK